MTLLILQKISAELGARSGVWPDTVTGWVALIASVFTLVGVIVAYAKALERINAGYAKALDQINGLGGRVDDIEKEQAAAVGRETQHLLAIERVVQAQSNLLREMGEHKHTVTQCEDRTQQFAADISAKIDAMIKGLNDSQVATAREIGGIQATLKAMERGARNA